MKYFISILISIFLLIVPTITVVKNIKFQQQCSGYLKQAADANTPELALDRINLALNYIESHNLTKGYTSVLWKTEDENIEFWYNNIKACKSELENCLEDSQLEKSNVLMKVRESLTDNGDSGTKLTIPSGISRYPNNLLFGIFNILACVWFCLFITLVCIWIEYA